METVKAVRDELFPWGWDAARRRLRVQVFGATGGAGRELVKMLLAAGHPRERLALYARRPVALEWKGTTLAVDAPPADPVAGDLAFLCTPPLAARFLAPKLVQRGARVVDLSGAFRGDPEVPLVVPEVNGGSVGLFTQLVSAPDATSAVTSLPLFALERAFGLREVAVTSLEGASGVGLDGLFRLRRELENGRCYGAGVERGGGASPFPAPLVSNLIPAIGDVDPEGWSSKERRFVAEIRRLLARSDLPVEVTAVQVPVERCHAVSVAVRLSRAAPPEACAEAIAAVPGVRVDTDPYGPRPRECTGTDLVHVGRIRAGARGAGSLCFFAVGDQLRKGAALNALQVASQLPVV